MSGIGTGYDLSATTFSPDGRIFQVEYASKAVENTGTVIALAVADGVVFGVEKFVLSKMLEADSNRRLFRVSKKIGMGVAGLLPDAIAIVKQARKEAANYLDQYGHEIPIRVCAERVALWVQAHTLYGSIRPFGATVLLGASDDVVAAGSKLFCIEPSGVVAGYFGTAIGKGKHGGKTEVEKLDLSTMTARDAVRQVARIVHDDVRDKEYTLEMSWMCEATGHQLQAVPKDILAEAEHWAKSQLEEEEEMDLL